MSKQLWRQWEMWGYSEWLGYTFGNNWIETFCLFRSSLIRVHLRWVRWCVGSGVSGERQSVHQWQTWEGNFTTLRKKTGRLTVIYCWFQDRPFWFCMPYRCDVIFEMCAYYTNVSLLECTLILHMGTSIYVNNCPYAYELYANFFFFVYIVEARMRANTQRTARGGMRQEGEGQNSGEQTH